ncbi:hypothetical protein PO883_26740 [Massilia sp. DJPM01]|uniref:hypothetical protein n=1 Tax=Massilia sp. DJPM01 TaxID=3024404 RepID=UPI00259F43CD|nr:hypothetical protein [Massilia sp. DJPM01]MDM5180786.1 hypothetical protein [Massilia sp. DJPM01]
MKHIRFHSALASLMLFAAALPPASADDGKRTAPLTSIRLQDLALAPLAPHLSKTDSDKLAEAWMSLVGPADPALAVGAVELLADAPPGLNAAIAARLAHSDRLAKAIDAASNDLTSRIRNGRAMGIAKLMDYAPEPFLLELKNALASGKTKRIVMTLAASNNFRRLPGAAVDHIVKALDTGRLEGQARDELFGLLANFPDQLQAQRPVFERWLADKADSPLVRQRQTLARTALLAMEAPLGQEQVRTALLSNDLAQKRAALRRLKTLDARARAGLSRELAAQLWGETTGEDWTSAYDLLGAADPAYLNALYQEKDAQAIRATLQADIAARWISLAPDAARATVAAFPLDMYQALNDKSAPCEAIGYQLALLTARSKLATGSLPDFWAAIVVRDHDCRTAYGAAIDAYLLAERKHGDPAPALAALIRRHGLGELTEWSTGSDQLAAALSTVLDQRLLGADWAGARDMMLGGARPSPNLITSDAFWASNMPGQAGLDERKFLRIVQAAGGAPPPVLRMAAGLAANAADPVVRAAALLALAASGRLVAEQQLFHAALADHNDIVAKTALVLLGMAYERAAVPGELKPIPMEHLGLVLTRPDLSETAKLVLQRLARFGAAYAQLQVEQSTWSTNAPESCWRLSAARPLGSAAGVALLAPGPTETGYQAVRACAGLLLDPRLPLARLVRQPGAQPDSPPAATLGALQSLWESGEFQAASLALRADVARMVIGAARKLPYDLSTQSTLAWWEHALQDAYPGDAAELRALRRGRMWMAALIGIPTAIFLHLGVWCILLTGYPSSPTLQAVVFWNPVVRKVLGFGYIDLVLLYVPQARRRLFAPFLPEFLRDIYGGDGTEPRAYFGESKVLHRPARIGAASTAAVPQAITVALAKHRGRVLLQGKSGLGKSSFLRFWLARRAAGSYDVMAYLRADQCRTGVEAEIKRRMQGIGNDPNLLHAMIYAGKLSVYVDGYNEVDLATQEEITSFVANYPHGNILVTSQIPLRGLSGIETFELQALDHGQVREFLMGRASILAPDAVLTGAAFERAAGAFLDDTWSQLQASEEERAFQEILVNPMDLTSIAILLSEGGVPDLLALENQQFEHVKRHLAANATPFRTTAFSRALLAQRRDDREDLGELPFKPEVVQLQAAKLAQLHSFTDPAGKVTAQEVRFRHERIRDFFTHFSFLDMPADEQATYANDARFAGVFPYLARSMPAGAAVALREQLITLAAKLEDHRVSDSFVRELSWRQRLTADDPAWMLAHDLPHARSAETSLLDLVRTQAGIEARILALQQEISASRKMTRILASADPTELIDLAQQMLLHMGARAMPSTMPFSMLSTPNGQPFVLLALSQKSLIRPFHVELLRARIDAISLPKLVIVNSQVGTEPAQRIDELTAQVRDALLASGALALPAVELYQDYYASITGGAQAALWPRLAGLRPPGAPA